MDKDNRTRLCGIFRRFVVGCGVIGLVYLGSLLWGRYEWAKAEEELRALDEPISLDEVLPTAVPDAENYFAAPFWQEVTNVGPDGEAGGVQRIKEASLQGVPRSSWDRGRGLAFAEPYNFPKIYQLLEEGGLEASTVCANQAAEELAAGLAAVDDLRRELLEASKRPSAVRSSPLQKTDYDALARWSPCYALMTYFERHAGTEASLGRGVVVAEDIEALLHLAKVAESEPFRMSLLFQRSARLAAAEAVWQGIYWQCWDAAQLADLRSSLPSIDMRKNVVRTIRAKRAYYIESLRPGSSADQSLWEILFQQKAEKKVFKPFIQWLLWLELASYSRVTQEYINRIQRPPPLEGKVFSENDVISKLGSLPTFPRFFFLRWASTEFYFATDTSLEVETRLRQANIALALEIHRLAHGRYPATLEELPDIPREPLEGATFSYEFLPDDGYRIWSEPRHAMAASGTTAFERRRWDWTMPGGRVAPEASSPLN